MATMPLRAVLRTAMLGRQRMAFGGNHLKATFGAAIDARVRRLRARRIDVVERRRVGLRVDTVFVVRHF